MQIGDIQVALVRRAQALDNGAAMLPERESPTLCPEQSSDQNVWNSLASCSHR